LGLAEHRRPAARALAWLTCSLSLAPGPSEGFGAGIHPTACPVPLSRSQGIRVERAHSDIHASSAAIFVRCVSSTPSLHIARTVQRTQARLKQLSSPNLPKPKSR
jgi:hypothetical protein